MVGFTLFPARMHRRELKRWETPRTPVAFLTSPLSHLPRLLCIHSACRQQLGQDVLPPPARACVRHYLAKSMISLPSPTQGWLLKVLRFYFLLSRSWERHLGRRLFCPHWLKAIFLRGLVTTQLVTHKQLSALGLELASGAVCDLE